MKLTQMFAMLVLAVVLGGCPPSGPPEVPDEVQMADDIAAGVNASTAALVERQKAERLDAIAAAQTAEEARAAVRKIDADWAPIWTAIDALVHTYKGARELILDGKIPLEMLKALYTDYCRVRADVEPKGVELADVPLLSCDRAKGSMP